MNKTLYQKYRPQNFDEIIGQDFIVNILKNSIKTNNIQSSYIFNGPRGTGKTSLARIFAKAINCESLTNPLTDDCDVCNYFSSKNEYEDILELDAASNNGVDDVRKIIENTYFQSMILKYKVYIIDEVHMFSKGAFNALLKTLENPPENIVFILATTEINKIPATILSRCQRLDFKRIVKSDMVTHLEQILAKENIEYEKSALEMIYSFSEGCMRDALSLLQKMIINSSILKEEKIREKLNIISDEKYEKVLELLMEGNAKKILEYWSNIYDSGINEILFIQEFQRFLKEEILTKEFDVTEKIKIKEIIYKVNDLEYRSIYSSNVNNIIEICFLDIVMDKKTSNVKPIVKNKGEMKENSNKVDTKASVVNSIKTKEKQNISSMRETIPGNIIDVLGEATKEAKIKHINNFELVAKKLSDNKKFGLAKFFLESEIKAASNTHIIVTIEDTYIIPYKERHDDLIEHVEAIHTILIISEKDWLNWRSEYMKSKANKSVSDKGIEIQRILENKLNSKVRIIEEE